MLALARTVVRTAVIAALAGSGALAQAQTSPALGAPAPRNFYFVLQGGLTGGGDKLVEAQVVSDFWGGFRTYNESIRAGGLLQFGAGVLWQPSEIPLAVQATINYHVDSITADNGDATWSRMPIEVLAYYTGVPRWRFGGGARWVKDAELEIDLVRNERFGYKDATGYVLEAGFAVTPRFWISGRYVNEDYELESYNGFPARSLEKTSGQSFGLFMSYNF